MFWGYNLKQGETLNLSTVAHKGDILHLSHINLHRGNIEGRTTVILTQEGKKFTIAHLTKENDYADVDLYFSTGNGSVFSIQGNGQVSLLGYFPPKTS